MSLIDIRRRDPLAAWAIARTLPLEGGFADDPRDPGGITNHGVSLAYAIQQVKANPDALRLFDHDENGLVDSRDIAGLTADAAAEIYFDFWWRPGWYRELAPALVAWKCFDIAVNAGQRRAALLLQTALGDVGAKVAVDGAAGPTTIEAVRAQADRDRGFALMTALRAAQADFYRRLAAQDLQLHGFLAGWLSRAAA